jgi:hypothetical protein
MTGAQKPRIPTLRLSRPYDTEEALIEGDFASIGRPWIILPDVPVLAVGELVRFEVLLATGAPAIRGEGTVVAHHPPGGSKPPGLEIKFTRMDARTKSIIERVYAKRLALRAFSAPPPMSAGAAPAAPASRPPQAAPQPAETTPAAPTPPAHPSPPQARRTVAAPANRDEVLEKLRARAKGLPPEKRFSRSA